MTDLFGDGYAFSDSTYSTTHGVRSFTDFESCAEETAVSRLYGGIHYDFGNKNGSYLGQTIGYNVLNLFQTVSSTSTRPSGLQALQLFPNPAQGQVFVKNATAEMASIKVFSLTGQVAKQGALESNEIDLEGLTSGLYIVTIYDKTGLPMGQQKLVVQ